MYRLEFFEFELKQTSTGREILKVIAAHIEEVIKLINNNRQVLVTWKRNKGALFFSQIMSSGINAEAVINHEIEGAKLNTLIRRMAVALQDQGSASLAYTIDKYLLIVLEYANSCNSLMEIFKKIRQHEEVKRKKIS